MVGCWRWTYPSIHFSLDEDTQDHGRLSGVRCGVCGVLCFLCPCGVCGVGCVCIHELLCRCVCCVVVCCVGGVCFRVFVMFLLFFLNPLLSLACSLSLSFSLLSLFSLLSSVFSSSSLFSLLFSPPNTVERTDQPTRRPTSRHLNVIWRTASAQQSVLSLLLSPPPFSPSPPQKRGNF